MRALQPVPAEHHSRKKVFIHPALKQCQHVFIRHDALRKPLQPVYDGPFPVLSRAEKHFQVETPAGKQTISVDRLKPAFILTDLQPTAVPTDISTTPQLSKPQTTPASGMVQDDAPPPTKSTRCGRRVTFPRKYLDVVTGEGVCGSKD